ncbi:unnamed protein product [Prorocentrum cordatum]|uniref:Uncharacterized protein n=1 Tax=Prorocentrum cordatum TaxID=2364126 RepID=A0ABN9R1V7_9DINO|nr:unnamed protein product [Polarella glacialis]
MTKEGRSLEAARRFHAALVEVKCRVDAGAPGASEPFEDRFRGAVAACLARHRLDPHAMGLRFTVCLAALWLPRPLVTPAFGAAGEAMDAGLRAWRRLGEARGSVPKRGHVLQVVSPVEIQRTWARVRAAYLDVVGEAGGSRVRAAGRLDALEAQQRERQERQLQRWNCRRMAEEEALQRRRAQGPRPPRPDAARRPAEARVLGGIGALLRRWAHVAGQAPAERAAALRWPSAGRMTARGARAGCTALLSRPARGPAGGLRASSAAAGSWLLSTQIIGAGSGAVRLGLGVSSRAAAEQRAAVPRCTVGFSLADDQDSNELDDMALVAIACGISASPRPSLQYLSLSRNRFGDAGVEALVSAVQTQCGAASGPKAAEARLLQPAALARWLRGLASAPNVQRNAAAADGAGTEGQRGMRHLDLSFNVLTDESARRLAEAVAEGGAPNLRTLSLEQTCIEGPGREALEGAIRTSQMRVCRAAWDACRACEEAERQPGAPGAGLRLWALPQPLLVRGVELERRQRTPPPISDYEVAPCLR